MKTPYPGMPSDLSGSQQLPSLPPRFVPTLTEVVAQGAPPLASSPAMEKDVFGTGGVEQELLIQRVLQRIDLTLDRRLREVVGQVVLEHTQTLAPRLRTEVESAVRLAVAQAFAQEK